ncbi:MULTISPECIES: hypothetical protein [Deinococcus]|uniref:Uncharacterized protein n=3 Tax=Deinococcus TaxID=1298 RepID=A0AAE3XIQ2_9DEIO|nr:MULTISPECIES: hypothetical protein [Deinococcus]MDR6221423.1 hypothetical protein [Deinococcus soli (ex Cha et al. 2016)]MDR6331408.1 hypothetical protein [Deinococcus soli (ex Cha et al. 2016)]MDR6754572.1 hypothetical protein [Deinococcus soli (ex Cha et al. 2016)]GAQ23490.1 hypothetical protein DEIGR_310009 [Deinococcus grandis]GGB61106.1 hypothetical protein GCM10008019_16340 [Deinococcus soli (ex Cha et al. 2016)]
MPRTDAREQEVQALLRLMATGRHPDGRRATWMDEQHANTRLNQLRRT